jgi:hypothetical protein
MDTLRFRSKMLLACTAIVPEGDTIILAAADTSMRIRAKRSPIAVSVPKTEARKFLKKFMSKVFMMQI